MDERVLREQLAIALRGGEAHAGWRAILRGVPEALRGKRPRGLPHSPWELLEHLRIAQCDILEFCRDAGHVSPSFPQGYWPPKPAPPSASAWTKSLRAFAADLEAMVGLVLDPARDLTAPIPHGQGQTLMREALLVVDHNAYHLAQMVATRQWLGAWRE
ncbi:MAG: DinB family protein [Terriglobales bacterium]